MRSLLAASFRFVDNRQLGFGALDPDVYIELSRSRDGVATDVSVIVRERRFAGNASLVLVDRVVETAEGNRYGRTIAIAVACDDRHEISHIEYFDPETQWVAALARLAELGGARHEVPEPVGQALPIENATSLIVGEMSDRIWAGDLVGVAALLDADVLVDDRRLVTSSGTRWRRDEFVAIVQSFVATGFTEQVNVTLVCRGEWHSLGRGVLRTETGDEVVFLVVCSSSSLGSITRLTFFDDGDLDAATELLDEWYVASLDDHSAYTALRCFDYRGAFSAGNVEAVAALVHNDAVRIDHREMGYGTSDKSESRAIVQAWADSAVNQNSYVWMDVWGTRSIGRTLSMSTTAQGSTYEIELVSVARDLLGC